MKHPMTDFESADSCPGHEYLLSVLGCFASMFLFFARIASAQVFVSEIMYDPHGGDTGHEWVEIVNQSGSAVDLAHSKFVEGGSSHGLSVVQGDANFIIGAYAVIADNAQTFLSDHMGFSGTVLDSTFSLKNTGETISLKIPDGTVSDMVSYTSDMGGAGDGNSLQKINGPWHGALPTPGVANTPSQNTNTNSAFVNLDTSAGTSGLMASLPVEPQIIADAGATTRTVSTGVAVTFTGRVFGLKKEPIENARMVWSFGDGGRAEGASVLHTYYYPGDYIVVLDAASGYYSASDRVAVHVVAPLLALHTGGDSTRSFVAVENKVGDEVDLSLWQVKSSGKSFVFPQNTILSARKTLTLASEVTGLSTPTDSVVSLHFPNGTRVETQGDVAVPAPTESKELGAVRISPFVPLVRAVASRVTAQTASVADALETIDTALPVRSEQKESNLWLWYTSIAFMGAIALFALRFTRSGETETSTSATVDGFEIVEEEDKKDDIF